MKEELFMEYDFDEIIDRQNTDALNTDGFRGYIFHAGPEKKFKYADDDFVRMWVADMEFAVAEPIRNAIKKRVDRKILGYTGIYNQRYYAAFAKWCKDHYDWTFPQENLVFSAGVIPALYQLIEDIVDKDEKVLTMTPAYGFFLHACEYNNVELIANKLLSENGRFTIDFKDLEEKASDPKMKLLILCNPHNPSGRIWTEDELEKIADIVRKNNLWIISDEIHCDLVRTGLRHTPMGKIMSDYKKLIICMSGSKTFNMAGLQFSNILIQDKEERERFVNRDKIVGFVNPISVVAQQAAYEEGGEWLEELKTYLDKNFAYVKQFLDENVPKAVFEISESTYLAWVNLNNAVSSKYIDDLPALFADHGLLLEGGDSLFVGNARGYIRLNLAMPLETIKKGMLRLKEAIDQSNI